MLECVSILSYRLMDQKYKQYDNGVIMNLKIWKKLAKIENCEKLPKAKNEKKTNKWSSIYNVYSIPKNTRWSRMILFWKKSKNLAQM